MKLIVRTPDETLVELDVASFNINQGYESFSVLNGHAPLISVTKDFVVTINEETGNNTYLAGNDGMLKVQDNVANMMIDYGIVASNKDDAKEQLRAMKEKMTEKTIDSDKSVLGVEIELMRRMQEMRNR